MTDQKDPSVYSGEVEILAVWQFLIASKVLIAVTVVLGGLLGGVAALITTPVYRSQVVTTPVRQSQNSNNSNLTSQLGGLASVVGINLNAARGAEQEALAVLRSRHLAELFIQHGDVLPQLTDEDPDQTLWDAVELFRTSVMTVGYDQNDNIVTVRIDWIDPVVAAEWANRYVSLANEVLRERALSNARKNMEYLNEEVRKTSVVDMQRAVYNLIEAEMQNLMLASVRSEYAFSIVDPAVASEEPFKPRPVVTIGMGCVLGILLGIVVGAIRRLYRGASTKAL